MHPVFLKIGNFIIYWYGVMVALGVFVSVSMFQKYAIKEYKSELISKVIFWTIFYGIAGARFLHVLVNIHYYYLHPLDIIKIRNGGLAVEGAIISSIIFLTIYSKIKNFNLLKFLDIMAISVPIGQAIGRIGCFLNGCCYGKFTNSFLGVKFPFLEEKVHPTQLYYSISYFFLFLLLKNLSKKIKPEGIIFGCYLVGFSTVRYLIDFLRGDLKKTIFGLYSTQIIAILIFLLGGIIIIYRIIKGGKDAETYI